MKRRILLMIEAERFYSIDPTTPLENVRVNDIVRVNPKEFHIIAMSYEIMMESFQIVLQHPEFPEVPPGHMYMQYGIEEARREFPYLFVDTNPILYRKFGGIARVQKMRQL